MNILVRVLVAIIVAFVLIWLLGFVGLPSALVGLVALLAFLLVLFGDAVR